MERVEMLVVTIDKFFFRQKTAYEMRISYWSSDVCSYDLRSYVLRIEGGAEQCGVDLTGLDPCVGKRLLIGLDHQLVFVLVPAFAEFGAAHAQTDRKSVVYVKSVSIRVDLG